MNWIGQQKEYNSQGDIARLSVLPAPKGQEVMLGFNGTIKNRYVRDFLLTSYIGIPLYVAFYMAVNRSDQKDNIKPLDFDKDIIQIDQRVDETNVALAKLESYCNSINSNNILDCYRHLKATLAAVNVIISEFDWSKYEDVSSRLTMDASNINQYVTSALAFISSTNELNNADRDLLNFVMMNYQQISPLILDEKIVSCLGIRPTPCEPIIVETECSCSDSDAAIVGWVILVIFIILLLILGTFLFLRVSQT